MEIIQLLNHGSYNLKTNNISSHQLDSELLLSKVMKKRKEDILINLNEKVSKKIIKHYNSLIKRRATKEPIAYILNEKEFWSKKFLVNENTLIPRPETELLVEAVLGILKNKKLFLLDVGTGTGCILLSILSELKNSKGIGIDISKQAIKVAKKNSKLHKLTKRAKFYVKNLNNFSNHKFDLVVSNPPYIRENDIDKLDEGIKKFEPKLALNGGNDGLDVIKKVIYKSKNILKFKGALALEIGYGQYLKVSKILSNNKFKIKHLVKDYGENVRCIISTLEN